MEKVARIQIDAKIDVDVNAQDRECGNALQAPSDGGHEKVVQIKLEASDVDCEDASSDYDSVLKA